MMASHAAIPASFRNPTTLATPRAMRNAITGLSSAPAAIIEQYAQLGRLMARMSRVADLGGDIEHRMVAETLTGARNEWAHPGGAAVLDHMSAQDGATRLTVCR